MQNKILFCIMAVVPWFFIPDSALSSSANMMNNFFLALSALSGTLLGFANCCLSIFMSVSSHRIVNNMKKTEHYETIIKHFKWLSMSLFASMIFSLFCYFMSEILIWKGTISVFIFSLAYLVMTGKRFYKVMSLLGKPEGNRHRMSLPTKSTEPTE